MTTTTELQTATPTPIDLGFDFDAELAKAIRKAITPMRKRLQAYADESARLTAAHALWSDDAFRAKLETLRTAAMNGDEDAITKLANGGGPSHASYRDMAAHAWNQLEAHRRGNFAIFRELKPIISGPMLAVADLAQAHLDASLKGMGLPKFKLKGAYSRCAFIELQCDMAGRDTHGFDLSWLWAAL